MRAKRRAKMYAAWAAVYGFEMMVAAVPTAALAAWIIPAVHAERGYNGFGGEYLVLGIVFWLVFTATHKWICRKIFDEEASGQ
ncbi:hypothetical protein EI53_01287 [Fusobacterium naviforme]|nr:hypothetical protein F7P78_06430 [Fusobacterium naviforme]PSL10225.1 hypothetical protein EI53_01287 [Fusobacterium naviforme]STO27635.1 Uncharacterised protein [Fusobacterium naviforme]